MRKDAQKIIIKAVSTEKALRLMESENKLVFEVDIRSNKQEIKNAIKELLGVSVAKINTKITPKGKKYAIIKFPQDVSAVDIASELQML